MKKVHIKTLNDLEYLFSKYSQGFLFRGQTKHYLDENQNINIPTSFSRHGCIPPLMLKWTHYSNAILSTFMGYQYHEISFELSQAILQHYGWRSFFVDLTKSPAIACWFAANQYKESPSINMTENFEEDFIWLVHKQAQYISTDNSGHIYIIDTKILEDHGIHIYDLTELKSEEAELRFHVQQACLAGKLNNKLPEQSIILHAEVDSQILSDYYIKNNILEINDVFPNRSKDFILNTLLEMPWKNTSIDEPIPIYKRTLELPEYDIEFFKFMPEDVTLFDHYWIADNRTDEESPFHGIPFYRLPETAYYSRNDEYFEFTEVNSLLEIHGRIALELDGIIKSPEAGIDYEKGILIEKNANTASISALMIKHPGHLVSGIGITLGWYYKIENELWSRIEHPEQCPCNNHLNHELQFALLRIFNEYLKTQKFLQHDPLNYVHEEVLNV